MTRSALLAALLALALTACGEKPAEEMPAEAAPAAEAVPMEAPAPETPALRTTSLITTITHVTPNLTKKLLPETQRQPSLTRQLLSINLTLKNIALKTTPAETILLLCYAHPILRTT